MIKIEKKIIKNKPFFYISEQINLGKKYKKIQVYLGKNIPNKLEQYHCKLKEKEFELIKNNINNLFLSEKNISKEDLIKIEKVRLDWKYFLLEISDAKLGKLWNRLAIQFIFESNAIEGSRLSQDEVASIINKKYIKKSLERKEIAEVRNAIKAFNFILKGKFSLNQRSIIELHRLLTSGLGIADGYKKKNIIVNNKKTVASGKVRGQMVKLLERFKKEERNKRHPLFIAADFHDSFEHIHPFEDGNGRVGRLLFNWMLNKNGYGAILFRNKNRRAYFEALNQADEGRPRKLYRHSMRAYKRTMKNFNMQI
jgi:fido (protein-threonine AMPylation protein)